MGDYNSFIVRVWTDGQGRLHGKIEDVATRDDLVFIDLQAILPFIRNRLSPPIVVGGLNDGSGDESIEWVERPVDLEEKPALDENQTGDAPSDQENVN